MSFNNKKIGILTFHGESNYGAFLQTFALSETLKRLGCDVKIIDLKLPIISQGFIKNIFKFVLVNQRVFSNARASFLTLTTDHYFNSSELKAKLPAMDLFIVGSDQVWNEEITKGLRDTYFFDFLPDDKKRIAYAASFGTEEWLYNESDTEQIKILLNKFNAISVREKSAVQYCKDKFDLETLQVLDPTLLLNDYSKITGKDIPEKNDLICFKFVVDNDFFEFSRKFGNISNKKVVFLNNNKPIKKVNSIYFPTIKKWLKTIGGASLIITDSFHGLCFSILYKRQFIVIPGNKERFIRLNSLLELLGLTNRIFYSYEEVLESDRWRDRIDYVEVYDKLEKERDSSISFLQRCILADETN